MPSGSNRASSPSAPAADGHDLRFAPDFSVGTLPPGGDAVFLEVADSGCGIDAATLPRIFDPFFTTKFTGRGLGLAAAQGIILRHNGVLQVRSRPGAGSVFRVVFPASAGAASAAVRTAPAAPHRCPAPRSAPGGAAASSCSSTTKRPSAP